jgi:hypothetical protein
MLNLQIPKTEDKEAIDLSYRTIQNAILNATFKFKASSLPRPPSSNDPLPVPVPLDEQENNSSDQASTADRASNSEDVPRSFKRTKGN